MSFVQVSDRLYAHLLDEGKGKVNVPSNTFYEIKSADEVEVELPNGEILLLYAHKDIPFGMQDKNDWTLMEDMYGTRVGWGSTKSIAVKHFLSRFKGSSLIDFWVEVMKFRDSMGLPLSPRYKREAVRKEKTYYQKQMTWQRKR